MIIEAGQALPELAIDVSTTFVVASAIATRDFQDVHHDRDKAIARGSQDIFLNILTTTGLVQRNVTDWAGPEAIVAKIAIRLGVPCYAGDTLTFSGTVTGGAGLGPAADSGGGYVIEVVGRCRPGDGLAPSDVDGLVTFVMDSNAEIAVARELGLGDLRFFSQVGYGGGAACATVQQAALAVAAGIAEVVVCYRALNERSGHRFGQVSRGAVAALTSSGVDNGWHYPLGLGTPAATVAMIARRYMHDYGATSEDFGLVTVADRRHAAVNPRAWFYQRPITLADHQASRWIAEPLRLLDCCQESDGAVAIVVTSAERARDLRQPVAVVARQLWTQAGLGPADVRTAILYDHFTPYVLLQLEELGFCPRGEARQFISGGTIELGGDLPLNTHGGQLGEAYIHGMNGIAEGVRQVRGTSVNQVPGDGPALVTAGTGVPTSGLILSPP